MPSTPGRSRSWFRVCGLALVAAVVSAGCLPTAQRFEALAARWTAEVSDLTGAIVAVRASAASPEALPPPAADAIAVRNVTPDTIEIGWLGDRTTEAAWFTVTETPTGLLIRYQVIAPPDGSTAVGYAFRIRFNRAVEAATITARPADWP
jgi:hypothetical protein